MSKILIDRAVVEQALDFCEFAWRDVLMNEYAFKRLEQMIATLRAALAEQPAEQEPDGLPLVVAGAIFDFAGYMTARSKVIEVGSTAEAGPVADLVKDWAKLRGLSLDDAAVLSWQEWLPTAPQPAAAVSAKPVAWVDVADAEHGPYEFHGIEKLPAGKHHLLAAPPAPSNGRTA